MNSIVEKFHPAVRFWFQKKFGNPSLPQEMGWKPISNGDHTLIVAPTGSGKTLAAFLWCINYLVEERIASALPANERDGLNKQQKTTVLQSAENIGVKVLYISPLKALNNDIHRNLEIPLEEILQETKIQHFNLPPIRKAIRTGDTTQSERNAIVKNPPDILITTPESFYLMLTSAKTRKIFHSVRYVIIDEIHSLSGNKRGVHLSLSLERLEELLRRTRRTETDTFVRIGLSATQKPLEEVAKFLGGMNHNFSPRAVTIIDAGYRKNVDLQVLTPVSNFSDLPFDSIWNAIYPQLLHLIARHKTTLVFVNSRHTAERLAGKLNQILNSEEETFNNHAVPMLISHSFPSSEGENISKQHSAEIFNRNDTSLKVYAYHGSMSRTVREDLEKKLKAGELRCLITTSALELGIDIGSIDLVVQIQSPKGIARGLQRIGRSGHLVHAESKGRILVTHRDDLLEAAVIAKEMKDNNIERTIIPKNCLDVLAQQIVSMVSVEDWNLDELFDLIRRSYNYHTVSKTIFFSVVEMLSGRFTNAAFRELRARIIWDKVHNNLSALPGSSKLAVVNAGTIPDRGYFGVVLEDHKTKVGEVDEEFMYESRSGDTFILGSNVWRMMDIDANKVVVQPAPGQPARMPFWRGESIGRTYELSVKIGEFITHFSSLIENRKNETAQYFSDEPLKNYPIDFHSARNIIAYLEEQQEATRVLPTHHTIVVEGFRDEIGDPRIIVHSIFGKSINGLLGIVLRRQLQERLQIEIQMLYSDNGILLRCSDVERLPLDILHNLSLERAQQILFEELPSSPLFGALFRQNAERAMLLPKGIPGKRRPFFLQRMKAADLLQIVKQYSDFPIVIETLRECLNDVLDFEHFQELLQNISTGEISLHTVQRETPSPFASGILFGFASVYMYEWDTPKRIAQQSALFNRELLSEAADLNSVKTVLRNDAVQKIEEQLQCTAATRSARSAEELMEIFLRLGELNSEEISARSGDKKYLEELKEKHIVVQIDIGGSPYFILTEELPIYLPIASVQPSVRQQIPEEYQHTSFSRTEAIQFLLLRRLRTHATATVFQLTHRYHCSADECEAVLHSAAQRENLFHGKLFADADEEYWCYRPNLDRMHKASISLRRKEIVPAMLPVFTQFLLCWQNRDPLYKEKSDGIISLLEKMEGFVFPNDMWETEIFKTRIQPYDGALLRSLLSRGEIFCIGAESGKSQWILRGNGNYFLPEQTSEPLSSSAEKILQFLKENGASFLSDLRDELHLSLSAFNKSLAELFWRGLITNDNFNELTNIKRYRASETEFPNERFEIVNPQRNPFRRTAMRTVRKAFRDAAGWNGRWSLVRTKHLLGSKISDEEKIRRQAQQLLLRYGIVAREIAKRENNLLPWQMLAMEFQRMEMRGEIRRGYFVQGLSGMQFALPEAVNVLETLKHETRSNELPVVLNACDPANPFGYGIELSVDTSLERMMRISSNYIIIEQGVPVLWLENFGSRIFQLSNASHETLKNCMLEFIHHLRAALKREIIVEYCNNKRPSESSLYEILRAVGFYKDKMQTLRFDI
ncbi:MAG: DEAD/DEAH box helicase [Bacteroidetes bacterium]|nr:DEAD/DEAH box helicase [Bacteroidota bacterium]